MNQRSTVALVLTLGLTTPAWARELECGHAKALKPVIAVSSGQHDLAGIPILTADIYLLDPENVDETTGMISVWRHLPGPDGDGAPAVSPDGKGRIVFDSNRLRGDGPLNTSHLFLMKADGRGQQRLLTLGSSATWSPDGKRIAFHASASGTGLPIKDDPGAPTDDSVIFAAAVGDLLDGELPHQVTTPGNGQVDDDADWSPVGDKIVFTRKNRFDPDPRNPVSAEIYVVNADGTGLTRLTTNAEEERSPAWSPDGQRIAYSCRKGVRGGNTLEICVATLGADGTIARVDKLTDNNLSDLSPHWSSDGRIVFQRPEANPLPGQGQQVWIMDAGDTVQTAHQLTTHPGAHLFPSWGEIKTKCDDQDDEDEEGEEEEED